MNAPYFARDNSRHARTTAAMAALVVVAAVPAFAALLAAPRGTSGAAPAAFAQPAEATLEHAATWPLPPADLRPDDVAVGPGGEVFVADAAARWVYIYDLSGAFRGQWAAPPCSGTPDCYAEFPALEPLVEPVIQNVRVVTGATAVYALWQYSTDEGTQYRLEARALNGERLDGSDPGSSPRSPRLGPRIDDMAVADDGMIYVLGGALLHVIQPSDLTKVGELRPGGSAADATRLAVLPDGRFVYTRPDANRVYVSVGSLATPPSVWDLAPWSPRDIAVTASGIRVLVSGGGAEPEPPLVLTLDTAGTVIASVKASELGVGAPTPEDLPWSYDAGQAGQAMTLAGTHRVLHGFVDNTLALDVRGASTDDRVSPNPAGWNATRLDLAGFDGDRLIAINPLANPPSVAALEVLFGTVRTFADFEAAARGTVADGTVYASPADPAAELLRIAPPSPAARMGIPCDCSLGGAVATQGDTLYVTRPRQGTVSAYDLTTGTNVGAVRLPDYRGLWPTDVAVTSSGRLVTSDPVAPELQVWANAGQPRAIWLGSGSGTPRRVAVGHLTDGTEVVAALMTSGRVEVRTTLDGNHVFGGLLELPRRVAMDMGVGMQPELDDLAVRDGRLYVADPIGNVIHAFALPVNVPPAVPTPDPTPSAAHCEVSGDKVAGPRRIEIGESAAVTLTLRAECTPRTDPVGADIVIVIDQDYYTLRCRQEPWSGALLELEVLAAKRLLEGLDVRYHRVGLVASAHRQIRHVQELSDDVGAVIDSLDSLNPVLNPGDDPDARGVRLLAQADELLLTGGRPDALPVVVFISPGELCRLFDWPETLAAGLQMRNSGVQILTVHAVPNSGRSGPPPEAAWLLELAGSPARHFSIKTPRDIDPLARRVHALIQELAATSLAGSLFIIDELSGDVDLIADSVAPPALEGAGSLTWRRSLLPSSGLTMTYDVRPTRLGDVPTNLLAFAEFTDVDGARRRFDYPVPYVEVVAPAIYLPVALKQECVAARERVDVVLVIDASSSMNELGLDGRTTKIEAARAAARDFVKLLRQGNDRVGLLSFNATVTVVHPLSDDLASAAQATAGIGTAPGTRLHLGIQAADQMLAERSGAARAMVILSDGRSDPDPPELAIQAARAAAEHGITVFAVALGRDADEQTLAAIVSQPSHLRRAADGSDLAGVYANLARELPCGR